MRIGLAGLLALLAPGGVAAQDGAAGEALFAAHCVECHYVADAADAVIVGKRPASGPNLFGVAGRAPASLPGFFYSPLLRAYGATGAVWDEAAFVAYVQAPTEVLQAATGEGGRSRMPSGLVADAAEAEQLWAYLAGFAP